MLLAQISDLHIKRPGRLAYRQVDTAVYLRRAVETLNQLDPRPDYVLATGDLVDAGAAEEYTHLRDVLADLAIPLLPVPGNHDSRAAMRAAFADLPFLPADGFIQYVVEAGPLRLIGLDSIIAGAPGGAFCAARRAWLAEQLAAAPTVPTVLFLHHPPFRSGIAHMDAPGFEGAEALADLLRAHPQVERLLCGHLHRPIQVRFGGTIGSVCPAPAHQVALDLRPAGPPAFRMEPPGLQLHQWLPGTGLVTHTLPIGDYPGPFPFFHADGSLID